MGVHRNVEQLCFQALCWNLALEHKNSRWWKTKKTAKFRVKNISLSKRNKETILQERWLLVNEVQRNFPMFLQNRRTHQNKSIVFFGFVWKVLKSFGFSSCVSPRPTQNPNICGNELWRSLFGNFSTPTTHRVFLRLSFALPVKIQFLAGKTSTRGSWEEFLHWKSVEACSSLVGNGMTINQPECGKSINGT